MQSGASLFLRLGLGYVFVWAGVGKVFKGIIPSFMPDLMQTVNVTLLDAPTAVLILGGIELIIGLLLVLGLFTRFIAVCALIYLIASIAVVGIFVDYSIVWNNVAHACMAISIVLLGGSGMSVDAALHHDQ